MYGFSEDVLYFIDMVGIASSCIGNVTIDDKYALIQVNPTCSVAIVPRIGKDQPAFEEVVFYTHCLAYEHDLPAYIWPANRRKALIQPIEKARKNYVNDSYYQSLGMAYEALNSLRLGPLGYVWFRWSLDKDVDLQYTDKYSKVAKEISLYSTAVRQLDPLSEFLHYYRVIESISGKNGKDWISNNLHRIKNYEFGFLEFRSDARRRKRVRKLNSFSIYRRRAMARLNKLNKELVGRSLAEYFYNENRCGIAHGISNIKEYDFSYNIEEISNDVYILKLLARIAIEDKM